jgi:hypothetical protein
MACCRPPEYQNGTCSQPLVKLTIAALEKLETASDAVPAATRPGMDAARHGLSTEARLFLLDPASCQGIRVVSGGGGIRTLEGPNGP